MKKFLLIFLFIISFQVKSQTFNVGVFGNNYTLTCLNSVITMTANSTAPTNYTWTIAGNTLTGNDASITQPGTWTVIGQNTVTSAISQQTFFISQNIISPTVAVTPTVINITCNVAAPSFTGTSNLGPNVSSNWLQFAGTNKIYTGAFSGTVNVFQPGQSGVYWFESVNLATGCASTKSVLVTSSVGVPVFRIASPTNFTIGCGTNSCTSMQVTTVTTSPVPNVAVGYTFCPPPATVVITPTMALTLNPNQNLVCVPGVWVVYVKDLSNDCLSSMPVNVIQNTVGPNAYISAPLSILNCNQSSMMLTGISSNTNTTVSWTTPSNSVINSPNIIVTTNTAIPNASTNITSLGSYFLSVTDNITQCVGSSAIQINQDIREPVFTISASINSIITCANQSVTLSSVVTPTLATALTPTFIWQAPLSSTIAGTSFTTTVFGVNSSTATSLTNGCTYVATFNVGAEYVLSISDQTIVAGCPSSSIVIAPSYPSGTLGLTFTWSGPTGAIISPTNQSSIVGNTLGVYSCIITNTADGCSKTISCTAVCSTGLQTNSLNNSLRVYPNPSTGQFTIESSSTAKQSIQLFDVSGRLVLTKEINGKASIDATGLSEGVYNLVIKTGEESLNRKLVIVR